MRLCVLALSAFVLLATLATGCDSANKLTAQEIAASPQLASIHRAFAKAVDDANHDPNEEWHSGNFGNFIINTWQGRHFGLCYHWQQRVYSNVHSTVADVGWAATGIMMNRAEQGEHHCVLVYDPTVIDEEDLLTQPPPTPTRPAHGWVLDAWERGEPDIYPLHEWRKVNTPIRREWELQDLTTYTTWDPSRARAQVRKVPDPEDAPLTDGADVTPANSSVPPMQKVWMR